MAQQQNAVDAVVVGAGFAGMYQLHRLRQMGLSSRVFEAGDGVGGTWYWNRYPGARCDVESIYYSYTFSPELDQEWEWTERYAPQPEILRYAQYVAKKFDLERDITFSTRVVSAHYDDEKTLWEVRTDTGETVHATYLITAVGCLSKLKLPEIPGVESFSGPVYHTGQWPRKGVDFTGKRVGLVGTGSSGVQSIPMIARQAAALTVFQRTPSYCMPARNRPLDPARVKEVKAVYPDVRQVQRTSYAGVPLKTPDKSALEVDEAERERAFRTAWDNGGLFDLTSSFKDIGSNLEANAFASEFFRERIREIVSDPGVAELLSPRTYGFGAKRPCLDTGYYDTFNLPHVKLVDLRKTPLERVTEKGIQTTAETYEFDAIVFATGFDAMTGALMDMDIRGKNGLRLADAWAEGPKTLLGLCIAGFPNMFTITGPLSPSVLANVIVSIEQHVDWITDCIAYLRDRGIASIEAIPEAQERWVERVADISTRTIFPTADSWYVGANVPGKPRVFMAYAGGLGRYRDYCAEIAAHDYPGFILA